MKRLSVLLVVSFPLLFASNTITQKQTGEQVPWFTGPLIALGYTTIPAGHINYEPFVFITANTGVYTGNLKDKAQPTLWNNSMQHYLQVGLSSRMNFDLTPTLSYNYRDSAAQWTFNDLPFGLDIQLLSPKHHKELTPYIKLRLGELFPTGKYQKLDPKKQGADIGGAGSFQTTIEAVIGKLIQIHELYYVSPSLTISYVLPAPVRLKGFNAYGGGFGTKARFFPGQTLFMDLAFEISLSRNWAFACDTIAQWTKATRFTGNPGVDADGQTAVLGRGSSFNFSMAPALEYNFSDSLGVIGGSWFSITGRNTVCFWSAVIAVNYYK